MVHRYSLLLIAVAFYYAQAFIPIMSLDVPDGALTSSPIAALSWLSGYSPHPVSYTHLTLPTTPYV